jgi:predicted O-methyltransferase YrrM
MILNTKIPGWNSEPILRILATYAAGVQENGHILELGALFGRSTYALGHNKKPSVKLTTIDIWPTLLMDNHRVINYHDGECGAEEFAMITERIKYDPERLDGEDFYELWKEYNKGISNLQGIRARTDIYNKLFPMVDIIFHDAGHTYEDVYNDLVHWFPKLKQEGVIIIDDYEPIQFPGVIQAVDQFVKENNLNTEMVTGRNILLRRKL